MKEKYIMSSNLLDWSTIMNHYFKEQGLTDKEIEIMNLIAKEKIKLKEYEKCNLYIKNNPTIRVIRMERVSQLTLDDLNRVSQNIKKHVNDLINNRNLNGKIITICGSMKFQDKMIQLYSELSSIGNIVLLPIIFNDVLSNYPNRVKLNIISQNREFHKKKIDLADEILIANVNGYIGDDTRREIEYAKSKNKVIKYLE